MFVSYTDDMNIGMWGLKDQKSFYILVAALILVGSSVVLLHLRHDVANDPYRSTGVEISKLIPLVTDLQAAPDTSNPGRSTRLYIRNLHMVKQHCQRIQAYNKATTSLQLDTTQQSIINQSRDMCADLVRLADYSLSIYTPTETLLSAHTTPRRYETLQPISKHIREQHLAATENALYELQQVSTNDIDFPSSSRHDLAKLEAAIKDSKGLDYLPSLRQFQMNLLSERQRFWGPYANAAQLNKSLQSQLDAYCQTLDGGKSQPGECKKY